eukprot:CAMPEP_0182904368 /NCGR_PEP_ID=MMETSP0034_2-20130328/32064_1 /TAXON_ID=156128 /ORGANISM="Nephroselmis pyriformis, Strain CCMP717" /LENGTH=80 /DNA_ID=CAMNT_0025039517 /DNA_START=88 /DNA_END=327 /DNA_ORIENTATION=+
MALSFVRGVGLWPYGSVLPNRSGDEAARGPARPQTSPGGGPEEHCPRRGDLLGAQGGDGLQIASKNELLGQFDVINIPPA